MTRQELHSQLDSIYVSTRAIRLLVHALIELEVVTEIACQWPTCKFDDKSFDGTGVGNQRALSIDHVIPLRSGGSDLPSNLRITHRGCNNSWKKSVRHTPEWNDNIRAGLRHYRETRSA